MKRHLFLSTILSAVAFSAMHTGVAEAADASSTSATPSTLNEVIVTARARTEDVKKVPTSISVLSAATLQNSHITSFEDLSRAVPGVSFGAGGGPGLDVIEMRGVSSTSGAATVGVYLDDVPITVQTQGLISSNGSVEPKMFDMDRVEILRGPQGTLYGASSEGGAIRFISNQPNLNDLSLTTSTSGSATVHGGENYDEQLVVNVPIIKDKFAIRAGIDIGEDSGWINQLGCCGTQIPGIPITDPAVGQLVKSGVNDEHWTVLRLSAKYEVNDTLTIKPAGFIEWDNSGDTSVYYPQVGLYEQEKEVPEPIHDKIGVASLTITKDLGFATLSSISSYFQQQLNRMNDGTFYNSVYVATAVIPPNPFNPGGYINPNTYLIGQLPSPQPTWSDISTLSQELRLTSNPSGNGNDHFSWVAGLFVSKYAQNYFNETWIQNFVQEFTNIYGISPTNSTIAGFTGEQFPNNLFGVFHDRLLQEQVAAYGDFTYSPIPELRISAGLRESYSPGHLHQYLSDYFNEGAPPEIVVDTKFNALTPQFSIDYDVSSGMTLYASAGKGNRLGGGNYYIPTNVCAQDLANLNLTAAPTSYDTDSLWSYEGGLKGRFLNDTLAVNADGFFLQWNNLQQTIGLPICGDTMIVNVGNAESYGPELEINYQPIEGLTFGVSYAYTHAAITKINPEWASLGISVGQAVLNVPEWMAAFKVDYIRPISDKVDFFVRADYDFTGPSFGEFTPSDPDYRQPEYSVMNGSFGITRGAYEISIFAKNLLDSKKIIQVPSLLFTPEAYTLRPLTAGVLIKARF
jgi:outer membrane receptor protein involved in Fe transport